MSVCCVYGKEGGEEDEEGGGEEGGGEVTCLRVCVYVCACDHVCAYVWVCVYVCGVRVYVLASKFAKKHKTQKRVSSFLFVLMSVSGGVHDDFLKRF